MCGESVNPTSPHTFYFHIEKRYKHCADTIQTVCTVLFRFGRRTHGTKIQRFSGNRKTLDPDAEVLASLHHFPGGGGALQHCRPDLHCQRRLPRLLRQRGQYGRLPADCGRAGHRGHDRGRGLRLRLHLLGRRPQGRRPPQHRQRNRSLPGEQPPADGRLSFGDGTDPDLLRRQGKRGDLRLREGILFLDCPWHALLHVWPGHEPHPH